MKYSLAVNKWISEFTALSKLSKPFALKFRRKNYYYDTKPYLASNPSQKQSRCGNE